MHQTLRTILIFLKRVFSKLNCTNIKLGFTLAELLAGVVITAIAGGALMHGITLAKTNIRSIQIEELAFNKLQSHTEYWKGNIAAGRNPLSSSKWSSTCIEFNEIGECKIQGELFYDIINISPSGRRAQSSRLITKIRWIDNFEKTRLLEFNTSQFRFRKSY